MSKLVQVPTQHLERLSWLFARRIHLHDGRVAEEINCLCPRPATDLLWRRNLDIGIGIPTELLQVWVVTSVAYDELSTTLTSRARGNTTDFTLIYWEFTSHRLVLPPVMCRQVLVSVQPRHGALMEPNIAPKIRDVPLAIATKALLSALPTTIVVS